MTSVNYQILVEVNNFMATQIIDNALVPNATVGSAPKTKLTYSKQVADQQAALNKLGAGLKVDGLLGPLTQAAISKYGATSSTPTGLNSIAQPPTSSPNNLTPQQISQGYSTIPGGYDPATGKPKSAQSTPTTPTGQTGTPLIDNTKLNAIGVTNDEIAQLSKPGGMDQLSFTALIDRVKQRLTYNNELMGQRALIVKHLFDSPLSEEEQAKLPEDVRNVLAQGKDAAELQLRVINDQLQGRAQSLSSSIQDLTSGYQTAIEAAEKKKSEAEDNILKYLQLYGAEAVPFLKTKYPEASEVIEELAGMKTIEEREAELKASGFGGYSEDQLKAITKINQDVSKNSTYSKTTSMRNYADNVIASLSLGSGVGDIAAINQFQKVIDEGAVTRDQDVKLIQDSQSLVNTLKTKVKKLEKGEQLSPELRKQMREAVEKMYTKQVEALKKDPYISAKTKEAELYGITALDTILGELGGFTEEDTTDDTVTEKKIIDGGTWEKVDGGWRRVSFKSVGGDTNKAIKSVDDAMARIARNESEGSGGYTALGPVVTTGMYKGQRALGKYQVMPGNLPEWSKLALGRVVTPEEFMSDPTLQEEIVRDQMERNYKKYGNWNDVASVWFTGKPASMGANKKDVLGTTGAEYVRNFNA